MTETPAASPEPSNAAILAAIEALTAKVDDLATGQQDIVQALDLLGQDVMAVKVDTGFIDRHISDFQAWARAHVADPNAHRRNAA